MNFGVWEGVPWQQIPKEAIDGWTEDFSQHRFGGQESVAAVLQRVGAAWDSLRAQHSRSGQGALWITHAGVARAVALCAQGRRSVQVASDWPREAPGFGAWCTLALD